MNYPIRILQVAVIMNRGGAETLIMDIYRNIDRSKVQFDFLTCKEGTFDCEILKMGGKVHRIPYITDVGHLRYVNELNKFFKAFPDYLIVHSHLNCMSGIVLRSAKIAGVPIRIAHSHSTARSGGFAAKLYKRYAANLIESNATHFFACSQASADWLFRKVNATKITIVHNGVNLEKFVYDCNERIKMRRKLNVKDECLVIGHVGSFSPSKNHLYLLDIFAEIHLRKPESILFLAGDGVLRNQIEEKVSSLGLSDSVKFLGLRDDISSLLQSFDIIVFPSHYEGLPVSIIEAQASGLGCLLSDNITKEVDLGLDLVKFISINKKPSEWADTVLSMIQTRKDYIDVIRNKGYGITDTAKWLEKFYCDITKTLYDPQNAN